MNLWDETINKLKEYSLTWNDVDAVILENDGIIIPKGNFEELARKTNYDNGYGGVEIRSDLVLVGWNWWLERAEYDGLEWWELKTKPFIPHKVQKVTSLMGE